MNIEFDFEWADPGEARGADLRATWSRTRILVGDCNVTRILDRVTRSERDAVYGPLLPLAEWIVTNWFFLFHEVGSRHTRDDIYSSRHSLKFAGEGFALPNLNFLPEGTSIELQWLGFAPRNAHVQFLETGSTHLPIDIVRRALANFVQAVADRLVSQGVTEHALLADWASVQQVDGEEAAFASAAASLSFDPFSMPEEAEEMVIQAHSNLPADIFEDFLAITRYDDLVTQIAWVRRAIAALNEKDSGLTGLQDFRNHLTVSTIDREPHAWGRALAIEIRQALSLNGAPIEGLRGLADLFGHSEDFDEGIIIDPDPKQQIHALMVNTNAPRFLLTRSRLDSQRFALARGFFDYIVLPSNKVDLVADSFMAKDKASRAFAAEILAPAEGLKNRITSSSVNEDDLFELAEEFGVSTRVIEHQIENHLIADIIPAN